MNLNIVSERAQVAPVRVGWFLHEDKMSVIMYPPERVGPPGSADGRFFMVRCPYDIHIGFVRDDKGQARIVNRAGPAGGVRSNKLSSVLHLVNENEWRYPDKPILQVSLSYCFIAGETCYITQLDAFGHYRAQPLPGTIFGGRFPAHAWVRPLMWAFEWHDTSRDLILRRGDPLFYCQFEVDRPDRDVELVHARRTPEIERWMTSMQGVASFVNQTFSLFRASEAARPRNLIVPED